jgi:hypothetical protein
MWNRIDAMQSPSSVFPMVHPTKNMNIQHQLNAAILLSACIHGSSPENETQTVQARGGCGIEMALELL